MMTSSGQSASVAAVGVRIARHVFAGLLLIIALALLWLGGQLVWFGGSPYYVITGLAVLGSAWLLRSGDRRGAILYATMLAWTLVWALWEVGLDGWALAPRLIGPFALGLWLLTPWAFDRPKPSPMAGRAVIGIAMIALLLLAIGIGHAAWPLSSAKDDVVATAVPGKSTDWPHWGNDAGGSRFSPIAQIDTSNVATLEPAWTFRTGLKQVPFKQAMEATPIKIGPTLYLCTPQNDVVALDAETGRQKWRYAAHADTAEVFVTTCRGVAHYRDPTAAAGAPCADRILTATIDSRLIAIDAKRGTPCAGFGKDGVVDLRAGMGEVEKGYYFVTSAPQVVRGKVVLGGWINDNQHVGEPSGVIRAFDAVSGRFAWAFDIGRPDRHDMPPPGDSFTRNTPNSWAPISADETLGLVFLPTGNAVPDWYGGQRRTFDDRLSSSVVALDADTGALRWSFQTTHHDLWDYDVASQPTLYDMPMGDGRRIPAIVQPTKRGEIFVLDRRTGKPLTTVAERRVPRSAVPGERASPTQPFSVGMPSFAGPPPTEKRMWGLTPIDQAWCRVEFRKSRWDGPMTPPGLDRPILSHPGYQGGIDWGGVSIDRQRDIMIVNANQMSVRSRLIPRATADQAGVRPVSRDVHGDIGGTAAQAGTPYAVSLAPFLSPLMVPCEQPPWGTLSGVDMKSRKLLWTRAFGTGHDSGPLGLRSRLSIPMGVPNTGGALTTGGGVTFIGATLDQYFRAYDSHTGALLWQVRLPAGAQATPMTYVSDASGRQFVVIAVGGSGTIGTQLGDYVMAFALPRRRTS